LGVVVQLTDTLNVMWRGGGVKRADFARNYVLSFAAVLALGFLLLVSLLVTAGLAAADVLPPWNPQNRTAQRTKPLKGPVEHPCDIHIPSHWM